MGAEIVWLWDNDAKIFRKALCDTEGKLIISDADPFEITQTTPEDLRHVPHGYHLTGDEYLPFAVDDEGRLRIATELAGGLDDLDDVTLAALVDGQFLSYSVGLGYWQNRVLADGDIPDLDAAKITSGELAIARLKASIKTTAIPFIIDGGGAAITTGEKGHLEIPFACTINRVTMLADQEGSIKVDIWKDTYALFPPTNADTICGGNEPEIITGIKDQDATLTDWTTAIAAGDILAFNVDSITDIERVTISLKVTKT